MQLWAFACIADPAGEPNLAGALMALPTQVFTHREDAIRMAERHWDLIRGERSLGLQWTRHRVESDVVFSKPGQFFYQVYPIVWEPGTHPEVRPMDLDRLQRLSGEGC